MEIRKTKTRTMINNLRGRSFIKIFSCLSASVHLLPFFFRPQCTLVRVSALHPGSVPPPRLPPDRPPPQGAEASPSPCRPCCPLLQLPHNELKCSSHSSVSLTLLHTAESPDVEQTSNKLGLTLTPLSVPIILQVPLNDFQ